MPKSKQAVARNAFAFAHNGLLLEPCLLSGSFGWLLFPEEHAERQPVFDFNQFDLPGGDPVELVEEFHDLRFEREAGIALFEMRPVVAAKLDFSDDLRGWVKNGFAILDPQTLDAPEVDFLHPAHKGFPPRRQPFIMSNVHCLGFGSRGFC